MKSDIEVVCASMIYRHSIELASQLQQNFVQGLDEQESW